MRVSLAHCSNSSSRNYSVAFASIGTVLTVCIGKVLIRLNYESLHKEADFRFSLVRVRENAESIAFYQGERVEEREADRRFELVIANVSLDIEMGMRSSKDCSFPSLSRWY